MVPERAPLFVCDQLLADPTGQRVAHRLYLPLAVCTEVAALEADPFPAPGAHTPNGRPVPLEETRLSGDDTQLTYTQCITLDAATERDKGRKAMGRHSDQDDNKKDTISTDGEEKGRPIPYEIPGRHKKKDDEKKDDEDNRR